MVLHRLGHDSVNLRRACLGLEDRVIDLAGQFTCGHNGSEEILTLEHSR
jgi:hypothetical protein